MVPTCLCTQEQESLCVWDCIGIVMQAPHQLTMPDYHSACVMMLMLAATMGPHMMNLFTRTACFSTCGQTVPPVWHSTHPAMQLDCLSLQYPRFDACITCRKLPWSPGWLHAAMQAAHTCQQHDQTSNFVQAVLMTNAAANASSKAQRSMLPEILICCVLHAR